MTTEETSPVPPDWVAQSPEELRQVWSDLQPADRDPAAQRRFRGQRLTLEQAGNVFERWVLEAFRLSGHTGHYPFRVPMRDSGNTREQIDGLFIDGWQAFLLESKFWTSKVDFGPIALLHVLLETRPAGTLGLFFSAFGYTTPALASASRLHPKRVLLFDDVDLNWFLTREPFRGSMATMVRRKWLLAVKYGEVDWHVSSPIEFFNE